jgi:hypothetical protein
VIAAAITPTGVELVRPPRLRKGTWSPEDIVDEWGAQSFPASDPPANW